MTALIRDEIFTLMDDTIFPDMGLFLENRENVSDTKTKF